MAASPEDLLAVICPSLLTTSGYQSYLDVAEIRTSSSFFGGAYPLAVALRAAHMYTLNTQRGGQSGIVTYLMEGRLAKSFGGIGVVRKELELSNYGQQLIGLIRASGPAITTTASDIYNSYLGRV
jgi:hypothetical protein